MYHVLRSKQPKLDLLAGEAVEGEGAAPVGHAEDVVGLLTARVPAQAPHTTRLRTTVASVHQKRNNSSIKLHLKNDLFFGSVLRK